MRPYNHPDNLDQKGNPKMSEDSWAISEKLRSGVDNVDIFQWPSHLPKPKTTQEAFGALLGEVQRLAALVEAPKDFFQSSMPDEGKLDDFLAFKDDPDAYLATDFNDWPCDEGSISTKSLALDCLAKCKAQKADQVETTDATDLASALVLVNELKAKLNDMNQ